MNINHSYVLKEETELFIPATTGNRTITRRLQLIIDFDYFSHFNYSIF